MATAAAALLVRDGLEVLHTEADDPAATALIAGLLADYTARTGADALLEFDRPHRESLAPWLGGDLLVLLDDGETVAGGGFRRYDSNTVQLDWLWTRPDRRRSGLARRVVAELEYTAAWRGYQRAYAVAGPAQPEIRKLLPANGYTALLGAAMNADLDYLGFVKTLEHFG
jgi:GNAT superfamily N-acetyltransferase